jgi:hypothetical protein
MEAATLIGVPPAVSQEEPIAEAFSRELQNLWFALAARSWSALAVVPAPGVSSAAKMATGLFRIGRRTTVDRPVALVDATGASLDQVARLADELSTRVARGERVLVAVDRLDENPAALALASRCDAAVLCVAIGKSDVKTARAAVERCGRTRFLGTAVLVPNGP